MLECTASVTIAIDPVMAPATILIRIKAELEAIDRRAAPAFRPAIATGAIGCAMRDPAPTTSRPECPSTGSGSAVMGILEPPRQRARRSAAMADRVLLG